MTQRRLNTTLTKRGREPRAKTTEKGTRASSAPKVDEKRSNLKNVRVQQGQITEFAAAFVVFLMFALALINVSFIPVRYLFCQGIVSDLATTLAHCEKRSDADTLLKRDQTWKAKLANFGVTVLTEQSEIIATASDGSGKVTFKPGQPIPPQWLPNDPKSPVYSIAVKTTCRISPAIGGDGGAPGLFGPVTLPVRGVCQWENTSPDAKTSKYFLEL